FARAGADWISVHQEACPHLDRTIHLIKEHGARAGVVLNPATPAEVLKPIVPELDLVLLMTVNPGFGGQAFIPRVLKKVESIRRLLDQEGLSDVEVQVDGGINPETAKTAARA